ncbi:MAG: MFS transporter [Candidatus Dormibacteraeota bacterium]|nr:MFS transporter [Candidatus Dormibacteraeota bacterium]
MAVKRADSAVVTRRSWLTPGVFGIGLASFLADAGHEVPTALLPSFLTATLGAPAAALGVIEGLADGAAGGARLLGGALADDPQRRRRTAAGGYIGTAVLAALIGLTGAVWQAALLRIAAWTTRGLRVPPRNALLADLTEPATYGRAYGFERAMDNLGAIAGPLLALLLVVLVGARGAMLLSVVPGLLAAGAIVYAIRQIPRPKTRERQPLRLQLRPVLRGRLGRLMVGVGAFELGHAAATLLILRATTVLAPSSGQELAVRLALVLYIGYNAVATVVSVPAGRAGDRWGAPPVLLVGVIAFLFAYLGFAVASGLALLAVAFLFAGAGIGLVETAENAAVAALAPAHMRGSAFGVLAATQGFGQLVASAVAGLLWTAVSPVVAFGYLAMLALLAIVGVSAALRRKGDS